MELPSPSVTDPEERFERMRQRAGWVLAPVVGLALWLAPLPVPPTAHTVAAVFAFTVLLWMTEAVPMAVAALLGPLLLVLGGVAKMDVIFASFGHPILFLFLGSFLLAEAMQKHGLDRRIALGLMSVPAVSKSPARMLAALGLLTAGLSMWMSNTAVTAVMLPIVIGVLRAQPALDKHRRLATALVLMVAFSASIGGLATPVGTSTNLVALGQLERFGLPRPSFAHWMGLGVPLMLGLLVALFFLLVRGLGHHRADFALLAAEFRKQRATLGPMSRAEWNTAIVFLLTVSLWLYPGVVAAVLPKGALGTAWMAAYCPEEVIGLVAGVVLFLLPTGQKNDEGRREFTLCWRDAASVEWGTILLFGGGFALGLQMRETGLSKAIGDGVVAMLGKPDESVIIIVAVIASTLLSEATSNTASAQVMVPLMIDVARSAGADPTRVAVATCLACSLGFMLPISTPPNALAYATKRVPLSAMIRYGIGLDVAGLLIVWAVVRWLL